MKKLAFVICLILCTSLSYAQEMQIDHARRDVVWTKVYITDMTQEEILTEILARNLLLNVVTTPGMIAGDIPPYFINYKAAGYGRLNMPLYMTNAKFGGRIILRFKEGRYHAEVCNMYFGDMPGDPLFSDRTYLYDYNQDITFNTTISLILRDMPILTSFQRPDDSW